MRGGEDNWRRLPGNNILAAGEASCRGSMRFLARSGRASAKRGGSARVQLVGRLMLMRQHPGGVFWAGMNAG